MRDAQLFCDLIFAQALGFEARGDGCDEFAAQAEVQGGVAMHISIVYWEQYISMPASQYARHLARINVSDSQLDSVPGDADLPAGGLQPLQFCSPHAPTPAIVILMRTTFPFLVAQAVHEFTPRASIHTPESEHQPAASTRMRACVSSPA